MKETAVKIRTLAAATVLIVGSSVALAQSVDTDHDPAVDFTKYHSYTWVDGHAKAQPLNHDRIVHGIDAQLAAKGWKRVDSKDAADAVLIYNVASQQERTLSTMYTGVGGYGYGGWGMGMGSTTTYENVYTVGTMILDIYDAKTEKLIWRGTASDTIPEKSSSLAKKIDKAVVKLFKKFPPPPAPPPKKK
jgi:hypothetical protein